MKARASYAIRVTLKNGVDTFLRHGAQIGRGDIVKFRTKKTAEINVEMLTPGLDDGSVVTIVRLESRL